MFTHHRQQKIIKVLLQDPKWHTLEEISRHVQCSVKTVQRDLAYLKDHLPSDWQIQAVKGKGVQLYKPPHSSHTSMYSFFKQQDMQFRVLGQLLKGDIRTVAELADVLYVQVSSLSTVLQRVQRYLDHFKLKLYKRPLRIVGEEAHIVYMFYELYFTTYTWEDWPFPEQVEVFSYISEIEQKLDIQFYPSYKQRLAYLLAIYVQRKNQGHVMRILPVYKALVIETPFYHKIKAASPVLCGIKLTKVDRVLITIAVNCCMFVYLNRNHYKKEILQHYDAGHSTVYRCVRELVEELEREFGVAFHQDEELLFYLLQYLKQISYRNLFIPTITSPTSDWHDQVKRKHYATFQKVGVVYTKWVQKYSLLPCVNEEDILAITLQLEASFHLSQTYCKKALLYLGDSVLWMRYIQGVLYDKFGKALLIVPEEVLDIHTYDIHKLDVDCIVTTVPLERMDIPVIQISVIPTRRELDSIKKFLDKGTDSEEGM
ncbi:Transcriptional antiterminator [Thermoactinomyces sp. DSM 45891]|uniref:BglG family transcription antiterminator n=1 Tax=Thermoactinomyces sp. DSM 45891 TaxID=1761907 RepID=UPI000921336A|nr:helix-turn-helix domain-containing protein [Thermoactinomyces sp. DSM 45891]SFX69101.1 Transcriptional antiterminator [Thermoactinomyces sp. DSM 45891]